MFRNFMMISIATGLLAMTAPSAFADDPVPPQPTQLELDEMEIDTWVFEERCKLIANNPDFDWANGYIEQAKIELRQAAEWRELANNARAEAAKAKDPVDQASWMDDAVRREENARRLEESAKRNLQRARETFERFRIACAEKYFFMDEPVRTAIRQGDDALHTYQNPPKQEAPKPVKQEAKPKPKPQKPAKKPSKKPKPQSANNQAAQMAAALVTGLAIGFIGNELLDDDHKPHHKPQKPHKPHKPGPSLDDLEQAGDMIKPHKKPGKRKGKKMKKILRFL